MNEDLITSQECYADSFISTIFGYLLINRNTRFVSLRNCAISEEEINEAIAYAKQINEIGKEYFTIKDLDIFINENSINKLKPYLISELVRLIPPQGEIYEFPSVVFLGDKYIYEEYSVQNTENIKSEIFNAYIKRYVTREAYATDTLRLFNELAESLLKTEIRVPNTIQTIYIKNFRIILRLQLKSWCKLIRALINGIIKPGDDATRYFADKKNTFGNIDTINNMEHIPSLIEIKKSKIVVSDAYSQNKTAILPYLINSFDFVYFPNELHETLINSCYSA
jgi:hypothetical protein